MSARSDREILEERARQLAEPAAKPELTVSRERLLVFRRGNTRYALDTQMVLEVAPLGAYAVLPMAPAHCLGVAAARGELVALFDVAPLLAPDEKLEPPRRMLLCGENTLELAIAIDEALTLAETRELMTPPEEGSTLIAGIHPEGFCVLNGAALLREPRFFLDLKAEENVS